MIHSNLSNTLRRVHRFSVILLAATVVAGCARHNVNRAPEPLVEAPDAYSAELPAPQNGAGPWWTAFGDQALNALIEEALANNLTVAQAAERVVRAEALLVQSDALRKPAVDLTAGAQRSRQRQRLDRDDGDTNPLDALAEARTILDRTAANLPDGMIEPGELAERWQSSPLRRLLEDDGGDDWTDQYETVLSTGILLSWELDVWGRLKAESGARGAALASALFDYEALRLLLTSQVAQTYFEALEQRLQLALLEEQRESAETFLELIELRLRQGAASSVDLLQQQGQLAEVNAEFPIVESQLRVLENRLDVLLGRAPDGVDRTDIANPSLDTAAALPAVGVPVALLRNRPDLKAMQHQVVANDFRVASAIAARLPRFTLNGSLTYEDASSATSLLGLGGLDLFQPLLDWGRREAAVTEARSVFQESLLAYTQGYLLAIEEVEAALWREARQRELITALEKRASILEQTVDEARFRYSLGVTDYLPVLTAIQDLQDVQRELLLQRRVLVSLRVELFRAVGGTVLPAPPKMESGKALDEE